MANGWGGKRPGAGRPRGMMSRRNKALPIELRPRSRKPSAVFPREDFGRPAKSNFEMSAFELDAAIRREREYLATGRDPGRPEPPIIEGEATDVDTE